MKLVNQKTYKLQKRSFKKYLKNGLETTKNAESLMPKQCDMLEWPEELKEDCQEIVKEIHNELEACQPLTVVGVALFMINNRINTEQILYALRFAQ